MEKKKTRIKIRNLSGDEVISKDDLKRVKGGAVDYFLKIDAIGNTLGTGGFSSNYSRQFLKFLKI